MEEKSFPHEWEDQSYHGSPLYYCKYCNVFKRDDKAKESCPEAEIHLRMKAEEKERKERREYDDMIKMFERFEYLHKKYGNKG